MESPNLPNLPTNVARLPIPGNAEWALWFAMEVVFAIVWAASDAVDAALFVTVSAVITFAYLISRGIAKASRVLEQ
jgi:nicotinamide riboside transporter PnuC